MMIEPNQCNQHPNTQPPYDTDYVESVPLIIAGNVSECIGGIPQGAFQEGMFYVQGFFSKEILLVECSRNMVRITPQNPNYKFEMNISNDGILSAQIVTRFVTCGKSNYHLDLSARTLSKHVANYFVYNGHTINGKTINWVNSDYLGDNFEKFCQNLWQYFRILDFRHATHNQLVAAAMETKAGIFARDIELNSARVLCCTPYRIEGMFIR